MMIKLFWSMIVSGSALLVYPHFIKEPTYHVAFSDGAIDALEYPQNVQVLVLAPNQDGKELQAYGERTKVVRQYEVPQGWAESFRPTLLQTTNRKVGESSAKKGLVPEYVIRYVGRSETVDLIVDAQSGSVWFQQRGMFRPFYSKLVTDQRREILSQVRSVVAH